MPARTLALLAALLACSLGACGGGGEPPPRNVTREQARTKAERKDLDRARKLVKARDENVRGGVELAGFAQELQRLTLAGARADIEGLFLAPERIQACAFTRDRGAQVLAFEQVEQFLAQRRNRLDLLMPLPDATVVALVHKVRPRKRLMGARIGGENCPVESRGRVNVVVRPVAPPPDAIEHHFEAVFVDGKWWLITFEREDRDCSDLGKPDAFGCRALRGSE